MGEINSTEALTQKFFKHLVTHLNIESSQYKDPQELLAAILNAPKLSFELHNKINPQQVNKAAKEVVDKLIEELDLPALEKIAISLAAITGSNDLKDVLKEYRDACNSILETGMKHVAFSKHQQWFQTSFIASLKEELVERKNDKQCFQKFSQLLFETNNSGPIEPVELIQFAKDLRSALVPGKISSALESQLRVLLVKADSNPQILKQLENLVPWTRFTSSAVAAAFCANDAQTTASTIINYLHPVNSKHDRRSQRISKATELLAKKLNQESAAKLIGQYAKRVVKSATKSPHLATKIVRLIEVHLPDQESIVNETRKASSNIGSIACGLAKSVGRVFSGILSLSAMGAASAVGGYETAAKASAANQDWNKDPARLVPQQADSASLRFKIDNFEDEPISNIKRWDLEERERAILRRIRRENEDWYEMLKKLAIKELARSILALAEADTEDRFISRGSEDDLERALKIVRTKDLLIQVLNPSVHQAIWEMYSQKHFIHNMEMRPPSLLQICDLLGKNSPARNDANFKLN